MSQGLPIDLKTFRNLNSQDAKLDALFDVLVCMHSAGYECGADRELRLQRCEARFKRVEDRKAWDTTVASIAGLVGGAIVWVVKWAAGK